MAVEVTTDFSGPYITNGATTVFPFTFISMDGDEIGVLLRDADGADTIVSTVDYSVTRAPDGTGSVVFSSAPSSGSDLYVFSDVSFAQSVEFEDGSGWKSAPVNSVADRSAARDIWLKGKLGRALVAPIGESLSALPAADNRLGKFLAFDAEGNPVAADGTGPDGGLRSDLAASGGSALVGFLQAGTGAVSETLQTAMRRMPVTLEQFGGGTAISNNYTAMVAAFRTGRPIMLSAGEYVFSTAIDFGVLNTGGTAFTAPNICIFGDGMDRTTLKYTGSGTGFKGGRTVPGLNGYAQTIHLSDLTYSGNGTGNTTLGTVNNPAITYGNFTTNANNGLSGSDSTQYGLEWEMEGGCVIERCRLTKFYTPIRTKLGYGAHIRNNHITGNQIGIEVTQAVTTLSITGNLIERNAIGITLWVCGGVVIQRNAIQGNYAGCDIYSFLTNRTVNISHNYFEASPKCFVQNGSNVDLTLRPSGFRFEGNYSLEVDIVEMASGFTFESNSIKSFAVATANISGIVVENNRDHDDNGLSVFNDYTGTGAANIIKNDAPLIYSQTYDPPSLANNAIDAANVTVTGAAVGDFAQASLSTIQAGFNIVATVTAANTVRFEITNRSGVTVDLASGTLRVQVFKA